MMKMNKKALMALGGLLASSTAVYAQGSTSSLMPKIIQDLFDTLGQNGGGVAGFITTRAQFAIYFVLGLIILVAVVYSIMAGIKYIRSEGDPGKIEEAQKSIKAILMGIAAIFVGIIGIVLVMVIFGGGLPGASLPQVCLSAGESVGCKFYNINGIDDPTVQWCEEVYTSASTRKVDGSFQWQNWEEDKTTWTPIAALALAKQGASAQTTLTLEAYDASACGSGGTDIHSVDKNSPDSICPCINPSKGGWAFVAK
jgi:hypothetical protein